jgi:putative transposase
LTSSRRPPDRAHRVEDLVDALGIASISKSEISRICAVLDAEVEAFRQHSLGDETYPYLWLDATYVKVREGGRVVSMAALVATGVAQIGEGGSSGSELAPDNDEGSACVSPPGSLDAPLAVSNGHAE